MKEIIKTLAIFSMSLFSKDFYPLVVNYNDMLPSEDQLLVLQEKRSQKVISALLYLLLRLAFFIRKFLIQSNIGKKPSSEVKH